MRLGLSAAIAILLLGIPSSWSAPTITALHQQFVQLLPNEVIQIQGRRGFFPGRNFNNPTFRQPPRSQFAPQRAQQQQVFRQRMEQRRIETLRIQTARRQQFSAQRDALRRQRSERAALNQQRLRQMQAQRQQALQTQRARSFPSGQNNGPVGGANPASGRMPMTVPIAPGLQERLSRLSNLRLKPQLPNGSGVAKTLPRLSMDLRQKIARLSAGPNKAKALAELKKRTGSPPLQSASRPLPQPAPKTAAISASQPMPTPSSAKSVVAAGKNSMKIGLRNSTGSRFGNATGSVVPFAPLGQRLNPSPRRRGTWVRVSAQLSSQRPGSAVASNTVTSIRADSSNQNKRKKDRSDPPPPGGSDLPPPTGAKARPDHPDKVIGLAVGQGLAVVSYPGAASLTVRGSFAASGKQALLLGTAERSAIARLEARATKRKFLARNDNDASADENRRSQPWEKSLKQNFPTTRFLEGVTVKDKDTGQIFRGTVDLKPTLDRIVSGKPFAHIRDGTAFKNLSKRLPIKDDQFYYQEYVHPLPSGKKGPQRVVIGKNGEVYYTPDHYETFIEVR